MAASSTIHADVNFSHYILAAAQLIIRADSQWYLSGPEVFVSTASFLLSVRIAVSRRP
jgi:hypothetical protein